MYRRLSAIVVAAALGWPLPAAADGPDATDAEVSVEVGPAASQELGARLGFGAGGRLTPGGLNISGQYLYQLSELDWFVGGVAFTFGGGSAGCFRDRDNDLVCDHGLADGFSGELSFGVRRFFSSRDRFTPFAAAGLMVRIINYADDEVKGLAVPLWLEGGVRARVNDGIAIVGGAALQTGFGLFNRQLGIEPQGALVIFAGVEFSLD